MLHANGLSVSTYPFIIRHTDILLNTTTLGNGTLFYLLPASFVDLQEKISPIPFFLSLSRLEVTPLVISMNILSNLLATLNVFFHKAQLFRIAEHTYSDDSDFGLHEMMWRNTMMYPEGIEFWNLKQCFSLWILICMI